MSKKKKEQQELWASGQEHGNREEFRYDPDGDALYRYYKDRYISQGKLAMEDTMGQAASLTGGYGSSYAQNVGQQAYNKHLQELGDVIPQLYQLAYDRYRNRQRDAVEDAQWQQEQQERQRQFDLNYQLDKAKQQEDSRRFELEYDLSQRKYEEDRRQYDLDYQLEKSQLTGGNPGSYYVWLANYQGSGKRQDVNNPVDITKYDNGKVSTGNILAMQRVIGAEETGMWDKASKDAAGGLGADDAYAAFQKGQLQNRTSHGLANSTVGMSNTRAMERALGTTEDGYWGDNDIKAAGGLTAEKAWEEFQKGILQNRHSRNR